MPQFIVTVTPTLEKWALSELARAAADVRRVRDLKDGYLLVETTLLASTLISRLVLIDPIFIKHIMPVQETFPLSGEASTDLPVILEAARRVSSISPGEAFSVQCRRVGTRHSYSSKDVEVGVGRFFEAQGGIPTFSDWEVKIDQGQKVISIYLCEERGYLGCSTVRENLNEQLCEFRVFSRRPRQVSRAEFKLVEALRKFDLSPSGGRALDLGAAPGGWTRVLAERGMEVVAIDPADLAAEVTARPGVTHFKGKAEDYAGTGQFDLVVNDMNVEPETSAEMMVRMARLLRPRAFAIMTLKLVVRHPDRLLARVQPLLEREFEILRIKNLFHNRQEMTLLLRRK